MPYRIDIGSPPPDAFDQLVELGALDIEPMDGGLAAILPDTVTCERVSTALGGATAIASPATPRDDGSVWILRPRAVCVGITTSPKAIHLTDSSAFGTGYHPTTALCVEALEDAIHFMNPDNLLDVGTGSGILGLAALMMGVIHAVGIDTDPDAIRVAAEHARMNNMEDRFKLMLGGPEVASGVWLLVVANILAAPLMEMAPVLVRRVAHRGRLILSGIPQSMENDVRQVYEGLGMRHIHSKSREAWVVVVLQASW